MSADSPAGAPVRLKPGSRPEVAALAESLKFPMVSIAQGEDVSRVVFLDLGTASDLLDLIEDLCPTHVRCETCGEAVACAPCGIGDLTTWCPHALLCPECRFVGCSRCAEVAV